MWIRNALPIQYVHVLHSNFILRVNNTQITFKNYREANNSSLWSGVDLLGPLRLAWFYFAFGSRSAVRLILNGLIKLIINEIGLHSVLERFAIELTTSCWQTSKHILNSASNYTRAPYFVLSTSKSHILN